MIHISVTQLKIPKLRLPYLQNWFFLLAFHVYHSTRKIDLMIFFILEAMLIVAKYFVKLQFQQSFKSAKNSRELHLLHILKAILRKNFVKSNYSEKDKRYSLSNNFFPSNQLREKLISRNFCNKIVAVIHQKYISSNQLNL